MRRAPSHTPDGRILMAVVTAPHGVKGLVRLKSFAAAPEQVAQYPLTDAGGAPVQLAVIGAAKGVLLARIEGIADRDAAKRLKGLRLYVARRDLPPPEEEEFYHADLIGLDAALKDGTVLGRVRAIHDFGAGDTIEIERPNAAPVVVPFTRATVPVVDVARRRILVEPPEGLL